MSAKGTEKSVVSETGKKKDKELTCAIERSRKIMRQSPSDDADEETELALALKTSRAEALAAAEMRKRSKFFEHKLQEHITSLSND